MVKAWKWDLDQLQVKWEFLTLFLHQKLITFFQFALSECGRNPKRTLERIDLSKPCYLVIKITW